MAKKKKVDYTLYDIIYSVCGAPVGDDVYKIFKEIDWSILAGAEKDILTYMLKAYEDSGDKKEFPTYSHMLNTFKIESKRACFNVTDIRAGFKEFIEQRKVHLLRVDIASTMTENYSAVDLKKRVEEIFESAKVDESVLAIKAYGGLKEHYEGMLASNAGGFYLGVPPVDDLTGGMQPALTGTVAAFVSHGKSMTAYNAAYIQAEKQEYTLIVSMEIDAIFCYYILLSRHSYETERPIKYEDIITGVLTDEEKEYVFNVLEPDFRKKIAPYIMVVNGDAVPAYTRTGILSLYTAVGELLGGLSAVIWDHANLFLYVEKERDVTGNHIIKIIADLGKEFYDKRGKRVFTLLLAQVNREGYKKAKRTEGNSYDMTALSDFNELERSSTYITFVFAERETLDAGQMSYELVKNRIGRKMLAPEIVEVSPAFSKIGEKFERELTNVSDITQMAAGDDFFGGDPFMTMTSSKQKAPARAATATPAKLGGAKGNKSKESSGGVEPKKDF